MNFRDLQYIVAIADTGSFRRAAEQCHVSQPTLSMQVRKLEDLLGASLFERSSKHVTVTPFGQQAVAIARRIAQEEKQIVELARAASDPLAGEFRLGGIPTLSSYVFPRFVPALNKAFPKLRLLLTEDKTASLLDRLHGGRLDAALLALPVDEAGMENAVLFDDPFFLAVGPGHPLAKRKNIRQDDLVGVRLLLLDDGHCLRDQALDVCRAHGAGEETSFRATGLETLRLMVGGGSDVATLMPAVARQDRDGLCYIPFTRPAPSRRVGLVWRKGTPRGTLIGSMVRLLRETGVSIGGRQAGLATQIKHNDAA